MLSSLRSKLLLWYASALAIVTAAFGALLYLDFRRSLYDEIDARLEKQAAALASAILPESQRTFYVELTEEQVEYFDQEGSGAPYYIIWDRDGRIVDQSHPFFEVPSPASAGIRDRGDLREYALVGPADSLVLVGYGMQEERQRLGRLLTLILAVGSLVLVGTLAAGWFLTGKALAPITRISEAAATVSGSNLSARIDLAEMETELGQLATTINATFDRLQHAFDQQMQFTADASHELRTPLSIVLAQTELALNKERSIEEYQAALDMILRSARRMKSVVEGLLTLAHADSGTLSLHREDVDLLAVVEESCRMLTPMAAERAVKLVTNLEPVAAHLDRERIAEVVANLVSNAIRYNRQGGQVDVRLRPYGDRAVLEVADTGIGIPDDEIAHVFERFYRVDKARSRSVGGSGLGLAITKWIVEAHGGVITIASEEGVGTTFAVTLPRN